MAFRESAAFFFTIQRNSCVLGCCLLLYDSKKTYGYLFFTQLRVEIRRKCLCQSDEQKAEADERKSGFCSCSILRERKREQKSRCE